MIGRADACTVTNHSQPGRQATLEHDHAADIPRVSHEQGRSGRGLPERGPRHFKV